MTGSRVSLRGVRAYGKHGANPGERDHAQPFDIDVHLELDLDTAASSDALVDTVDYAALHARIVAVVAETSYALLERLCARIAADALTDPRIARVVVTVAKPGLLHGATPSVTLSVPRLR